jgi:translation initiation factor 3 subunit L
MVDRHWFANGRPVAQDSVLCWNNYCKLFDLLLKEENVQMAINEQWAFDLINEFVYSFQGFAQVRSDPTRADALDLEVIRTNPDIWRAHKVAYYLQKFIEVSKVNEILQAAAQSQASSSSSSSDSGASSSSSTTVPRELDISKAPCKLIFDLGYFSLFGLSRLECLLGDYHASLSVLSNVNLMGPSEYFQKIFGCYSSALYHVGFAYLMMMRFKDSIRTLGHIVCHIHRLNKVMPTTQSLSSFFAVLPPHLSLLLLLLLLLLLFPLLLLIHYI